MLFRSGWRGAINAMQTIPSKNSCNITQSFRFGTAIADVANRVLNNLLDANVCIKGFDKNNSRVATVSKPDAILCRTNAALIDFLLDNIGRMDVAIAGGCVELISLLRAMDMLKRGKRTTHHDLAAFGRWGELVEYSKTDLGSDLAGVIKLLEDYSVKELITALERANSIDEKSADLVLSTVHKAKGREWPNVRLADDFRLTTSKMYSDEEANLLYVAVTRAIKVLDISHCEAAQEAINMIKIS